MSRIAVLFLLFVAPPLALILAGLGIFTIPTNPLGWILLVFGLGYILGLIFVVIIQKRKFWVSAVNVQVSHEERGDRSFWLFTAGMIAVFYLSPLEYLYLPSRIAHLEGVETLGLVIFVAGMILFTWSRLTLGSAYSGHLSVTIEQRLVKGGPYRRIRHPAYAGFALMASGLTLGYSSWIGLLCLIGFLLPGLVYRIQLEEKLLLEQFGESYRQYSTSTSRILPGIW